ncbi:MAG: hypothetical protein KF708_13300 [Pirellulales bacterium]|nr:hypothetical protein [Pirellulales bacterium]
MERPKRVCEYSPSRFLLAARGGVLVLATLCLLNAAGCTQSTSEPAKTPAVRGNTNTTASGADTPGHGADYGHAQKIDPVEANGPIFQDWPKPRLAIVVTGQQQGYLEPCGCAGLENQLGGLSRRHGMLQQLAADGWPVLAVDVGGQVRRFGRQQELKFQATVEALKTLNYAGVALGDADLRLPAEELVAVVADAEETPSPFVAANVALFGFDAQLTKRYRIVEEAGLKVGITAVLGDAERSGLDAAQVENKPAAEALREIMPELVEQTDFRILLVHATRDESLALAKEFGEFDLVVTSGGADVPPDSPTLVDDDTWLVEVGHKGMYAAVIGLFDESEPPRYQRVPLDSRFKPSDEMHQLLVNYQDQLRELGWAGLGLTPTAHLRSRSDDPLAGQFASAESCAECHTKAHAVWSKSAHAHATDTLAKLNPPRQFDPECISCHSTGWSPQDYFPYTSGFDSLETTPLLAGNSCENCHGPGAAHVAAEKAKGAQRNLARRDSLRTEMRLTKATAAEHVCGTCHDVDNSPNFKFEAYWPKVEHKGKD